jgi:hypothetical protein
MPIFEVKIAQKSAFSKPLKSVLESGFKAQKNSSNQDLFLIYRTE